MVDCISSESQASRGASSAGGVSETRHWGTSAGAGAERALHPRSTAPKQPAQTSSAREDMVDGRVDWKEDRVRRECGVVVSCEEREAGGTSVKGLKVYRGG